MNDIGWGSLSDIGTWFSSSILSPASHLTEGKDEVGLFHFDLCIHS